LKADYVYSLEDYKHILTKMLCHKWTSHLESLLFFTNFQDINCASLDKARAAQHLTFSCVRRDASCLGWQRFGELCGMG